MPGWSMLEPLVHEQYRGGLLPYHTPEPRITELQAEVEILRERIRLLSSRVEKLEQRKPGLIRLPTAEEIELYG